MSTEYSSKAIILSKGRALILRRSKDRKWHYPGGHLNNGEKYIAGLAREIREELSQTILKSPRHLFDVDNTRVYQAKLAGKRVRLSHEHIDAQWIPIRDIHKLDLTKEAKKITQQLQRMRI